MDSDRTDLTVVPGTVLAPEGQPIWLAGQLTQQDGARVAPVLLEFWQSDSAGRYRAPGDVAPDSWFEGLSRVYSRDGSFKLHTVMPGPAGSRAPNITVNIFCDGITRLATQIFFDGEPANEVDPLLLSIPASLRSRLVARRDGEEDGAAVYTVAIVLRGEGETPFFDDLAE